ncbi:Hypothetical protein TFLO_970 [Trichococcus flocculiformis]|uniref:Uncharacterized protein n=1 Tax=Trichococcus flocculiformis TaxID=82803 RepID=A0AB38BHZ3_9LACT|nr:hypothetical protein [Trichococcus flocculiformis]CZQ88294.1 Hypothetical protein TFLO_970 [Trichococcus flocculiformis]SFH80367.1 hypothetical protein SAMN04488507_101626 [Trichococcus flocculiformis]
MKQTIRTDEIIHVTHPISVPSILQNGLIPNYREGLTINEETDFLNEILNKHRPGNIKLDRTECVFLLFKRDYLQHKHTEKFLSVDMRGIDTTKTSVFSNSVLTGIRKAIQFNSDEQIIKDICTLYWNSIVPFPIFFDKHDEIVRLWDRQIANQNIQPFPYGPEILYFGKIKPEFISYESSSRKG